VQKFNLSKNLRLVATGKPDNIYLNAYNTRFLLMVTSSCLYNARRNSSAIKTLPVSCHGRAATGCTFLLIFSRCLHLSTGSVSSVFLRKMLGTWYGPVETRFL